jgi:hypothetical protein
MYLLQSSAAFSVIATYRYIEVDLAKKKKAFARLQAAYFTDGQIAEVSPTPLKPVITRTGISVHVPVISGEDDWGT